MLDLERKNLISLREATEYCPYSQEYLSLRARNKKLKSIKVGRVWMTNRVWLDEYLNRVNEYKESLLLKKKDSVVNELVDEEVIVKISKENDQPIIASFDNEIVKTKKIIPPLNLPTREKELSSLSVKKEEIFFKDLPLHNYKSSKLHFGFGLTFLATSLLILFSGLLILSQPSVKGFSYDVKNGTRLGFASIDFITDTTIDLGVDSLTAVSRDSDILINQLKEKSSTVDTVLYSLEHTTNVFKEYFLWMQGNAKSIIDRVYNIGVLLESNMLYIFLGVLGNIGN